MRKALSVGYTPENTNIVRDKIKWNIMTKIYLAGPLFTMAEREFNKKLAQTIERRSPGCQIILPQDFLQDFEGSKSEFYTSMFHCCRDAIERSDIVLAILDGSDPDSGTCVEIGYAFALKKTIIGIRTDFRNSEDRGVNLMVSQSCDQYFFYPDIGAQFDNIVDQLIPLLIRQMK